MGTVNDDELSEREHDSQVALHQRSRTPRLTGDRRAALSVGLILLGVYWLTMGGHTYSVDGETYLAGTRAMFQGTTVLTPGTDLDGVVVTVTNLNGDPTTAAPIGTLALFAPGFLAGKLVAWPFAIEQQEEIVRLVYLSANGVMTAVTGALLFFLCRRLGAGRPAATLLSLTFGLGTWAWAHARTDFSEPGTAMMVTASVLAAVTWWDRPASRRAAALTGLLAGCAVLTRASVLVFVPILLLAGLVQRSEVSLRQRATAAAAFCLGGVPPALAMAINAWIRFGDPLDNGYPLLRYSTPLYEGLFGLFMSPGKGLLWYAPVCIVVLFGLRTSYLRNRRYALTIMSMLVAHAAVYARFDIWSGENAYGPRYLIPILPVIIALLAPVVDTATHWRRGVRIAAVVGFLIPGLLGSTMYFNAVYFRHQPSLVADMGFTEMTGEQNRIAWNFYPRTSPLMLQFRSLPDLARNTIDRIQGEPGGITPLPAPYEERIHWYARAVQLDTWWAWWPTKDAPNAIYLLLTLPLAALAAGLRLLRTGRRIDDEHDAAIDSRVGATVTQ